MQPIKCILYFASRYMCFILYISFYSFHPVFYVLTIVNTRWRQPNRPTDIVTYRDAIATKN